jgi:hypothetical protein
MNPDVPPTAAPTTPRQRRLLILRVFVAAVCVLVASILLVMPLAQPPTNSVVWLTPADAKRLIQPGKFTRLKWRLMELTAPVLGRLWRPESQIRIQSRLLGLPPTAAEITGLPAPIATNSEGARVWILSPPGQKAFLQTAQNLPGVSFIGSPSLVTGSDTPASLSMTANVSYAGKSFPVGVKLDLTPKIVRKSVRLILAVTSTSTSAALDTNSPPIINTNLNIVCQTWLGNRCGLVVEGKTRDTRSNGCWLVLVPTIVDSKGNSMP